MLRKILRSAIFAFVVAVCAVVLFACSGSSVGGGSTGNGNPSIEESPSGGQEQQPPSDTHTHSFIKWTSDGEYTHTGICSCNQTQTNPHSLNGGIVTKQPTCNESGVRTYTCTVCGEIKTETVAKTDSHKWGKWYFDTETSHKRACSLCGKTETESHDMDDCICLGCGYNSAPATIRSVANATVDQSDLTVSMFVHKSVASVNFSNTVTTSANSAWKLYDANSALIPTKRIEPQSGYNTYFMVVSSLDGVYENTYEVTVYKSFEVAVSYYGVYNDLIKTETVDTGYDYNVTYAPDIVGYTFEYWKKDGEETQKFTPYENIDLFVKCRVNTYNFSFDVNGGDSMAQNTQSVTFDSDYALPTPTREGHTFLGWYNGEDKINNSGTSKFASDIALSAKWSINSYTVSVSKNISAAGTASGGVRKEYGESVTITAETYLGYDFLGWYSGSDLIASSETYTFSVPANNVSYTATWKTKDEMSGFNFTSTLTTCTVTGVKNKSITTVTVPNYVTSIGSGAFNGCGGLEILTLQFVGATKSATWRESQLFGYIFGSSSYSGGVETRQYDFYNSSYITYYIPQNLKTVKITNREINSYAFYNCSGLASIVIGNGVTSIGGGAFFNCSTLASIEIPNSVTRIGDSAFDRCSSLTSIEIPNSVTRIGDSVFYGCSGLTSIEMGGNVTSIGSSAFSGCSGLTSIEIPSSVTSIEGGAFKNCSGLTSIKIPNSVTRIWNSAFDGCSSLTSIEIPSSVTSIEGGAFKNCSGLASAVIGNSVESIGSSAFSGCSSLVSIEIPSIVTSIGHSAFSGCRSLTSIEIPNSVTRIWNSAFDGCSSLTNVTFENTVGWKVHNSDPSITPSVDVSDTSRNATYLKSTYSNYYWERS